MVGVSPVLRIVIQMVVGGDRTCKEYVRTIKRERTVVVEKQKKKKERKKNRRI